jgi:hypothetical protein
MASPERDLTLSIVCWSHLPARGSAAPVVVGRDLGLDTTTVGGRSDLREDRPDGLDQAMLLMRSRIFQSCLDHIVGEGVSKKSLHLLRRQHLLNNHVLGRSLSTTQALLNYIGTELVA